MTFSVRTRRHWSGRIDRRAAAIAEWTGSPEPRVLGAAAPTDMGAAVSARNTKPKRSH